MALQPAQISNLPNEMLKMILENVSPKDIIIIPYVCRRWRLISKQLTLDKYSYPNYQPKRVRAEAVKINRTLRMFKRVKDIDLFGLEFAQCSTLRTVLDNLPSPVSLTLSDLSRRWKRSTLLTLKEYVDRNNISTYVFARDESWCNGFNGFNLTENEMHEILKLYPY